MAHCAGWHGGRGAKGYFVLDITHPEAFSESGASSLVLLDRTQTRNSDPGDCTSLDDMRQRATCQENKDLGHILAAPVLDDANPQRSTQITQLNNNRWALVTGNGYHSTNQRPVLLIQYLDGNQELLRLVATGNTPTGTTPETTRNGLSAPRLVDINGDGRPDVVYAGDIQGNLWKFLIASGASSRWGVASTAGRCTQPGVAVLHRPLATCVKPSPPLLPYAPMTGAGPAKMPKKGASA
ncbi:hypothetical protein GY15_04640 [Delftia sp. 670]|nr:hypothetical protein GY15_04640 [Delftia sp. 670]